MKFSERAEKHRIAASKYGALRRELEEILAAAEEITRETIAPLRQRIDRLAEEAPPVPDKIWSRRQNVIEEDKANLVGLVHQK
jgi:hypothetical protein